MEFKKIKANCPVCLAYPDAIKYQNSGPIMRVYCSKCGTIWNEEEARKAGYDNIIDYFNNSIGLYYVCD